MENEELESAVPPALTMLAGENLEELSIDELKERVSRLEAEIQRSQWAIEVKQSGRDEAESVFKH